MDARASGAGGTVEGGDKLKCLLEVKFTGTGVHGRNAEEGCPSREALARLSGAARCLAVSVQFLPCSSVLTQHQVLWFRRPR